MCNETEGSYDETIITIVTKLYLKKYHSFVDIVTVPLPSGIALYCGDTYIVSLDASSFFETFPIIADGFVTGKRLRCAFFCKNILFP